MFFKQFYVIVHYEREVGQLNIAMEYLRRFGINTLEIERES